MNKKDARDNLDRVTHVSPSIMKLAVRHRHIPTQGTVVASGRNLARSVPNNRELKASYVSAIAAGTNGHFFGST
jgi:hypothetical protein